MTAGASHRSFPLGPDAVPVAVHCPPSDLSPWVDSIACKTWHPRHLMTAATIASFQSHVTPPTLCKFSDGWDLQHRLLSVRRRAGAGVGSFVRLHPSVPRGGARGLGAGRRVSTGNDGTLTNDNLEL